MFDSYKKDLPGGTGSRFDWNLISDFQVGTPIILSGGLKPENIIEGITVVNPSAVDVNSGVEIFPGEKQELKIKNLFSKIDKIENKPNIFELMKTDVQSPR